MARSYIRLIASRISDFLARTGRTSANKMIRMSSKGERSVALEIATMTESPFFRMGTIPCFFAKLIGIFVTSSAHRLVKPSYPEILLAQNIEGKVMVQALVDTVGKVIEVQIMASTGEHLFERAAEDAVWQCRFRPFRPAGESPSEVYAVFRFVFSIYN